MKRRCFVFFNLIGALYAAGCAQQAAPTPGYDNSFWNTTKDPIVRVQIEWDANGHHFIQRVGRVSPAVYHYVGISKAESPRPIPREVTVNWTTSDGVAHKQLVQVASKIPGINNFEGSIFYHFTSDGVTVEPFSYAYQEKNVANGRAAVP